MFLVCDGKEIPVSLEVDVTKKILSINLSDDKLNLVNIPDKFFQDIGDVSKYSTFILKHSNLIENDIYVVYLKRNGEDKRRVGYLIPILAIESEEHDFSDDAHFWRFCNVAIRLLFDKGNKLKLYPDLNIDNSHDVVLSQLLGNDTAILVLSESNFDIKKVFPSLVSSGFVFQDSNILSINKYSSSEKLESIKKSFYIKCISNDLNLMKDEIYSLLQLYLSQENNVFRFFILYQIIEILITEIFNNTKEQLLDDITNGDINKIRDTIKIYSDESKRIARLVDKYSRQAFSDGNSDNIRNSCFDFLKIYESNYDKSGFNSYIYDIRNRLFHNFRTHDKEIEDKLELVVNDFVKLLPDILYYYSNKK